MSWVIIEISTNEVLFETWNKQTVDRINFLKYKAVPIKKYLYNLNKKINNENTFN